MSSCCDNLAEGRKILKVLKIYEKKDGLTNIFE